MESIPEIVGSIMVLEWVESAESSFGSGYKDAIRIKNGIRLRGWMLDV